MEIQRSVIEFKNADGKNIDVIEQKLTKTDKKDHFTVEEVQKYARQLNKQLMKAGKQGKIQIATLKWSYVCGDWIDTGNNYHPNIYSISENYDVPVEADEIQNEVAFYFMPNAPAGGASKCNDCLYIALRIFNGGKMLTPISTPYKFKKRLNIERCDTVDISRIPEVEDMVKHNIQITGDYEYITTNKYIHTCFIDITNGHYKIIKSKSDNVIFKKIEKITKLTVQLVVWCRHSKREFLSYDGTRYLITNKLKLNNLNIRMKYTNDKKQLKAFFFEQNELINEMKKETEKIEGMPQIDLLKNHGFSRTARYILDWFNSFSEHIDPVSELEALWIKQASKGGLIGLSKEAIGSYKNMVSIDQNGAYNFCLSNKSFRIPYAEPTFEHLSKYGGAYGIYKCEIEGDISKTLFAFNKLNMYSHFEINRAKELNLKINLLAGTNSMIYDKTICANKIFKKAIDYLTELKKTTTNQQAKKGYKQLLATMYGICGQRSYKLYNSDENITLAENEIIDELFPTKKGTSIKTTYINPYKYDIARFNPFITAKVRCSLSKTIYSFSEHVIRVHTDSFAVKKDHLETVKKYIKIGSEIGQWKIEKEGDVTIKGINNITWN